jgi:hypothetical protein
MEEALRRKLNKRNKKKGDDITDPAAPVVAKQNSGKPQPAAGNPEDGPMQGMIAASADSSEIGIRDPHAEAAAAEAKSSENTATSPPLTFQSASGAVVDAEDEGDAVVQRDIATMVERPPISHSVGLLPLSAFLGAVTSFTTVRRAHFWLSRITRR